jgi:cutinase
MHQAASTFLRRIARPAAATAAAIAAGGGLVALAGPASAAECSDVEVISARGTGEPGTLGVIVGDPVFAAVRDQARGLSVTSHAVDYPASAAPGSASEGNAELVRHITEQAAACEEQRFVLVGYSQGANVVGNSIGVDSSGAVVGGRIVATIPAAIQPRVSSILLFGNPLRAIGREVGGAFANRTFDICANGDPVCGGGFNVLAHLSYRGDADEAAAFAAERLSSAVG